MHPRLQEIEQRLAEIRGLLDTPDADLAALETEIEGLTQERKAIAEAAERRSKLVAAVVQGDHPVVRSFPTPVAHPEEERTFDAGSVEYRNAYLKKLVHGTRNHLGELNEVEKRAWTYLTTNTTAVLPTGIQLGIVDMIRDKYAILGDLSITGFEGAVEFQQVSAIVEGDAAETNENVANANNLKVTIAKIGMTGVEFRDSAKIGNKMRIQSIDQFESWLIDTLSDRIGNKMNVHVFDAIDGDIVVGNKSTPSSLDDAAIRAAFAVLFGGRGARMVYANTATIWNQIAAVVDSDGKKLFVPNSLDSDPTVQGRMYGSAVKTDDTLADDVIYIGYPGQVKANMFEAPNVESDRDVETRETVFGGYALFEARMGDTRSFAQITITVS